MNTLELFAGSRSFSKVAKDLGHNIFTTDINDFDGIDLVCDIMNINLKKIPYNPDIIWVSHHVPHLVLVYWYLLF